MTRMWNKTLLQARPWYIRMNFQRTFVLFSFFFSPFFIKISFFTTSFYVTLVPFFFHCLHKYRYSFFFHSSTMLFRTKSISRAVARFFRAALSTYLLRGSFICFACTLLVLYFRKGSDQIETNFLFRSFFRVQGLGVSVFLKIYLCELRSDGWRPLPLHPSWNVYFERFQKILYNFDS